jgi:hypothetical protein
MRCRRAFEADLTAVVRGEAADAAFAAHAAGCPDCDAEVRVWRELDGLLRAGAAVAPAAHPAPDVLVAFVDAPARLAVDVRADVDRHVGGCRVCADEVRSLRRFDAGALAAPAPTASSDAAPGRRGRLAQIVWHPAFAYALLALVLVPLVREQLRHVPQETRLIDARREVPAARAPAPQPAAQAPPVAEAPASQPAAPPAAAQAAAPGDDQMRRAESKAEGRAATNEQAATRAKRALPQEPEVEGAPSLHDLAGSLGRDADEHDGLAAAPRVVELSAEAPTIVPYALGARGVVLRIVPPAELGTKTIDVRVRGRAGSRELAQRVTERANAIAVPIPPQWLVPGDYVVTLAPVDAVAPGRGGNEPIVLGFTVRAPTAGEVPR